MPDALYRHVQQLSAKLPPRAASATALEPSARYIRTEFSKHSNDVSYQDFSDSGETFHNIIARFGPRDKAIPLYVIGAHYDSEGGNPGADDNASGVAALLELARLFSLYAPKVPVELVAFALEEPPYFRSEYMGSYIHASRLSKQHRDVALMIALECIGYYDDASHSQSYPLPKMELIYPDRGNFIALVGRLHDLLVMRRFKKEFARSTLIPVFSINAPAALPGIDFSDHLNYWKFDYPAIMVTDTAFYRNRNYHEFSDRIETLDFKQMAQVVDGIFGAITLAGEK